jgi:uncharacterized protein YcbX
MVRFSGGGGGGGGGSCGSGREGSGTTDGAAAREGVAFANEAPLLLLVQSAVDTLNANLRAAGEATVSARHFRPNLVVADGRLPTPLARLQPGHARRGGGDADETSSRDVSWKISLAAGRVSLVVTGACERCSMVEIDPTSGAKHGSVMRALARHHRVRSRLLFGVFCAPVQEGHGDSTELVELQAGSPIAVAGTLT